MYLQLFYKCLCTLQSFIYLNILLISTYSHVCFKFVCLYMYINEQDVHNLPKMAQLFFRDIFQYICHCYGHLALKRSKLHTHFWDLTFPLNALQDPVYTIRVSQEKASGYLQSGSPTHHPSPGSLTPPYPLSP